MPSIKSLVYSTLAVSLPTTVSAAGAPANRFVTQVSPHHATADPLSGVLASAPFFHVVRYQDQSDVRKCVFSVVKRFSTVSSKVDYGLIVDSLDNNVYL
ncbi:hypothetical protein RQP46_006715 [Phenoliferia psychrophenolica]